MDSSDPGEKCLPEMGLSGWMKRTMERSYDLTDFCNSPPADGFFYPKGNAAVANKGNCGSESKKKEEVRCTIMGGVLSVNQPITRHLSHTLSDPSMYHHQGIIGPCNQGSEVPEYLKPVVSSFSSPAFSKQLVKSQQNMMIEPVNQEGQILRMNQSDEVRSWTRPSERREPEVQSHPSDDSAPSPVDHVISSGYTPTIMTTPPDEDGGVRFERFGAGRSCPPTPDVTPAVTPACSPQVTRRTGNPFFTGGNDDDKNTGSWLFRPGKKADGGAFQSDQLYETKVEFQAQPNSKVKKTVRYVPRPSLNRELNFYSPTSM